MSDLVTRGVLSEIWISPATHSDMHAATTAGVVPGKGIDGDRYSMGTGSWTKDGLWSQVTLIEAAVLRTLQSEGFPVTGSDLRRNLIVDGVDLEKLIGEVFRIGTVELLGERPCDPCGQIERRVGMPGLKAALEGRGGLRASVLTPGTLELGAPIVTVS